MKTRRSWRNQNRLFKELFKPNDEIKPIVSRVCFNCSDYKSQRARGKCALLGEIVTGQRKACVLFKGRE